jgi:hypothetical protein
MSLSTQTLGRRGPGGPGLVQGLVQDSLGVTLYYFMGYKSGPGGHSNTQLLLVCKGGVREREGGVEQPPGES